MTQNASIIERNRAICQFLNFEQGNFTYSQDFYRVVINNDDLGWVHLHNMKFHTDWNWMMYLVEKIEDVGFVVDIRGIQCSIREMLSDKNIVGYVCGNRSLKINTLLSTIETFLVGYNSQTYQKPTQHELFEEEV